MDLRNKIVMLSLIFYLESAAMHEASQNAVNYNLLAAQPNEIHAKIIAFLSPPDATVKQTFANFKQFLLQTKNGLTFLAFMRSLMGVEANAFILNSLIFHYADCFLPFYKKGSVLGELDKTDASVLVALELNIHAVYPWIAKKVQESTLFRASAEKYLCLTTVVVAKDLGVNNQVLKTLANYKLVELLLDAGISANITLPAKIKWDAINRDANLEIYY